MSQEFLFHHFKNIGFAQFKFTDEQLLPVRKEIDDIKKGFITNHEPANKDLGGNIEKEYYLKDSHNHLEQLIIPLISTYESIFEYGTTINIMQHNYPVKLDKPWVNFQKKGEFNPNHSHSGVYSFVLYINIPYMIEDEMKNKSGLLSNRNIPAHFEFTFTNTLGEININPIPVDKTYENTILIFPAKMLHCVYPFYTSDDYRISISGNFTLNIS
jgi:hypothetical protein